MLRCSCLILKTDQAIGAHTRRFGVGNLVSTLSMSLDCVERGAKAFVLGEPLVHYREGDKTAWSIGWPRIWLLSIPTALCASRISELSPETIRSDLNTRRSGFLQSCIRFKLFDTHSTVEDFVGSFRLLALYRGCSWFWTHFLFLAVLIPYRALLPLRRLKQYRLASIQPKPI